MAKNHLIVVIGPTAVGKTALTIQLANHFNCDIVSADSRQFYKEMSIGTAKPDAKELAQANHHFIDSHSVLHEFSAGEYEKAAMMRLEELFTHTDKAILTGGSGLYINAVVDGIPEMPEIPAEIRAGLNTELEVNGLQLLQDELKTGDPEYYKKVDVDNPQRIIRALEVIRSTGKTFTSFREGQKKQRPFNVIKIGLKREREELYERINQRVDLMVADGLVNEVRGLLPYRDQQALQTVGYKEIFDYLDGQLSEQEAIELIKRNTRRYAKRQMTWFRKDQQIEWFHPDEYDEVVNHINQALNE